MVHMGNTVEIFFQSHNADLWIFMLVTFMIIHPIAFKFFIIPKIEKR